MKVRNAERTAPVTTSSSRSPRLSSSAASSPSRPSRESSIETELAAGIVGVEAAEELGRDLDLFSGAAARRARRRSLLAGLVDRGGEVRRDQRGQRRERDGHSRVANESSRETSWRVRSGISSPESAGSAIPIPTPARTCGATVHQAEAPGRSARQPTPPATSRQPATARVSASPHPRRGERRDRHHRRRSGARCSIPRRAAGRPQEDRR